jgi:hypothetical protein
MKLKYTFLYVFRSGCIDGYRIRTSYEDGSIAEGKNYNDFIKESGEVVDNSLQ